MRGSLADFNQDGRLDLLTRVGARIHFGDGAGTFDDATPFGVDSGTLCDVNNDGAPDLVSYITVLVVGANPANAAVLGGTLVPSPNLVLQPITLDALEATN